MSKKLTYRFVKEAFEKEGYVLLTEVYKNNKQKLDYICPKGHEHNISWDSWKSGSRCAYCAGVVKKDIEFVRSAFKNEGYTLLTNEYINSNQKLEYICPKGHKHSISWRAWYHQGSRCWYCFGTPRESFRAVAKMFEKENYKLLTTDYLCSKQKLSYICSEGHRHSITLSDWKGGHRCPTCHAIRLSISRLGQNNPSWKGGISCEPYCDVWLDKDFKESIKERDNYICQNPDCWQRDGKAGILNIHHIDYNKKNCKPSNLITVCKSCNSSANKDREWHKAWYQAILSKRYGYKYESSKVVGR